MTSGAQWYVVQTHPRSEARAASHLLRQGYRTYLPRFAKRRRHARRVDTVAAALFPGYLFVAIDLASQRWRSIQSTVGVRRLVCNGDVPAMLADEIVAALRAREGDGGLIALVHRPPFVLGERLRVRDGLFADCFGLYDGMADDERIAVLIDLLGRKVRVPLDCEAVTAA